MAERKDKVSPVVPASEVAATSSNPPVPDLASMLHTFKPVEQSEPVLKGNQKSPEMRFSRPSYGRTNVLARSLFRRAADDQKLQSPLFRALRVRFSDPLQALLCTPESTFVENQPDLLLVTWSRDEEEMRCDFAQVLVPKQWETPPGMYRMVPVALYGNLPDIGTAILLDLKHSYLVEIDKRSTKTQGTQPQPKTQAQSEQQALQANQPLPANQPQPEQQPRQEK